MRKRRISPRAPRLLRTVDQSDSIDLRRLRGHAALPKQIGLLRRSLHQDGDLLSNQSLVTGFGNLALDRQQAALAVVYCAAIHFAIQMKAGARILIRVAEHTEAVELRGLHELAKRFEIGSGLAGKSDDHAGAE